MNQVFQTIGILLTRSTLGTYDEKLTVLTEDFGKLVIYSYGSRSPRSIRGQQLRQPAWLNYALTRDRRYIQLRETRLERPIPLSTTHEEILLFQKLLHTIAELLPLETPAREVYGLLRTLSDPTLIVKKSPAVKAMLYPGSLLRALGELPTLPPASLTSPCGLCQEFCSAEYQPISAHDWIGAACPQRRFDKSIESLEILPFSLSREELTFIYTLAEIPFPYEVAPLIRLTAKFSPHLRVKTLSSTPANRAQDYLEYLLKVRSP